MNIDLKQIILGGYIGFFITMGAFTIITPSITVNRFIFASLAGLVFALLHLYIMRNE